MSASPPKSDLIVTQMRNVAKGPEATCRRINFDRLASGRKYRNDPVDRLGSLEIDNQPEPSWPHDQQVGLESPNGDGANLRHTILESLTNFDDSARYPILYP